MRLQLIPKLVFAALFGVAAAWPVHAQVSPSATQAGIPITAGVGFSDFSLDWGPGQRMEGITAWVDFYPRNLPAKIEGLGIEAEGRDINLGRSSAIPRMRQDTGLGGAIYTWHHYKMFHPYAKFLAGIGGIDFPPIGAYSHDTFLVTAPGGGAEYRIGHGIWLRGDYEYQFWRHTFGNNDLNPQGFTIGASYDFRHPEEE